MLALRIAACVVWCGAAQAAARQDGILTSGAGEGAADPPAAGSWATINVFHINPASYGAAPVDMNTGDALGDMYFDLRTKAISIECAPPIPPGNVHTCANGEVSIGLGRIVALYYRSSTLYQIH
jgi:hypothetical protein